MTLQAGRRQKGKSGDQGRARVTRGRKSRLERRYDLRLEALECRCLLAGDVVDGPLVLPPPRVPSAVEGIKWEDLNGNGQRDRGEPGLPGVIIYADLNRNGALDRNEPLTRTMRDNPHTREDETGRYWLGNLGAGEYVIREVVPDGFLQTFPPITPATPAGDDVPPDGQQDEVATIEPSQMVLALGAGERAIQTVTYTFHPICIREFPVSVRAEGTTLEVENLSGPQTNSCGGDTSKFEIAITGDGQAHSFELQLFDPESGAVLGTIPVTVNPFEIPGAHHVELKPNQTVSGIDFGNQRQAGSSIHGLKWNDLNANGQQDEGELGVAGVRIYLDLNGNGQYDGRDLVTLTMRDDPTTEVDETGHYWFNGLRPGEYLVGEVLPRGYEQTFPGVASRIVDQQNGQLGAGVALDLDVTDIAVAPAEDGALVGKLELTVVWPDSCGKLQSEDSVYTIIGDHIIVELSGRQEGEACAEVISPQQETLRLDGLQRGRYDIVASLHEELRDGSVLATLVTVATVELGGPGQHHVTLGENEHLEGINFGNRSIIQPGSVSGVKWNDLNGDGQRSDDERGLPGVVIYADLNRNGQLDRSEPRTTSLEDDPDTDVDETGQYELAGLPPRTYVIREVVPEGYHQTFPPAIVVDFHDDQIDPNGIGPDGEPIDPVADGRFHVVEINSGQSVSGIDFGNQKSKPGSIHGLKWHDLNGNGQREDDEPGLPGVTIYLDVNLNNQYDRGEPRTVTMRDDRETDRDEAGRYVLNTDYQGFAILREIVPDGYRQTFPEEFLCDAIFCVGQGHMVNVEPGKVLEGLDFGNQRMPQHDGVVSGLKWLDQNGNGRRDDGEPGLPGVMIYADLNDNGRLDDHEPHVRTSRDDPDTERSEMGHYRLEGIPAGKVVIREVLPNGFDQTFPVAAASVHERAIVDLPPGVAFRFDIDSATWRPNADGELGLDLTFTVTWPNSCGTLLSDNATTEVDGGRIRAELFGTQVGEVCLQALMTQTQTVHVPDIATGEYQLRAVLNENGSPGEPFRESYFIEARIKLERGAHEVELEPGQVLEGINFGNRRTRGPIDEAISEMADFDANGQLSSLDIDMLAEMLRGNGPGVGHLRYDLTGDGKVNRADMDYLLNVILRTPYGDSNMDGRFGSGDFVHVFMRGKYENGIPGSAKWEDGDWNGDGVFTSADLIHAMLHSNYEAPAEAADALFAEWE